MQERVQEWGRCRKAKVIYWKWKYTLERKERGNSEKSWGISRNQGYLSLPEGELVTSHWRGSFISFPWAGPPFLPVFGSSGRVMAPGAWWECSNGNANDVGMMLHSTKGQGRVIGIRWARRNCSCFSPAAGTVTTFTLLHYCSIYIHYYLCNRV